jgi:hypothetical protein
MTIPFLPSGAYAIIMDYYADGSDRDLFGYDEGESASMEASFWNRFPDINKMYYQVFSPNETVWDFHGAQSYRDDASIFVDTARIQYMIDLALSDMNYT